MAKATIDHDEIRRWAEGKGGKPAAVDRTHQGGDVGIIRIMFPDNRQSEHQSLVEISWDEFFEQFEESQLALLYEEGSLFSKIIGRDTLEHRQHGDHSSRHHPDRRHEAKAATPARADSGSTSREHRAEAKGGDDLAAREYRDAEGRVHHHTRRYEEQHGKR